MWKYNKKNKGRIKKGIVEYVYAAVRIKFLNGFFLLDKT